jgi:centractin
LGTERFLAPEILFNPELIGQEYPGVHQVSYSIASKMEN